MGHVLHAVVGPKTTVAEFASRWTGARRVDLRQVFALVPLTAALHDDIVELTDLKASDPHPGFERLSAGVALALQEVSRIGPVGYVETGYFGGVGTQKAVAWEGGKLLLGPFHTETVWTEEGPRTNPPGEGAINRVLAKLGVWTRGAVDPFDMLELGKFRDTESLADKHA